jgi:hypothetical protein
MAETPHATFRLAASTKDKLAELAKLDGITLTQEINNLIEAEYRIRRTEIEKSKK